MRFEAGAYRDAVEVKFDKGWYRGRLVSLVLGSEVLGVAFELQLAQFAPCAREADDC